MNIPIRDKTGNIIGMQRIDNPYNPPIDMNRIPDRDIAKHIGNGSVAKLRETQYIAGSKVIPTNQAFWKGRNPNATENK